ncbi:MAG: hypothetical protein KKF12_13570 [Proteobacteria bacterium]|nr:hypothetical protein [Pseudomonadota bacterium]MBU4131845.1 hypothetical protein [Pseudomonadota bacterium]
MTRENSRKAKHKSPKFRESYDEDFQREDRMEIQMRRKKLGKKSRRQNNLRDKW